MQWNAPKKQNHTLWHWFVANGIGGWYDSNTGFSHQAVRVYVCVCIVKIIPNLSTLTANIFRREEKKCCKTERCMTESLAMSKHGWFSQKSNANKIADMNNTCILDTKSSNAENSLHWKSVFFSFCCYSDSFGWTLNLCTQFWTAFFALNSLDTLEFASIHWVGFWFLKQMM